MGVSFSFHVELGRMLERFDHAHRFVLFLLPDLLGFGRGLSLDVTLLISIGQVADGLLSVKQHSGLLLRVRCLAIGDGYGR